MKDQRGSPEVKPSFSRNMRKVLNHGLPIVGAQIIISVILFSEALSGIALIMFGILLVEVGIFKLAPKLLRDDRKYLALRSSTNVFLYLVRQLNTAALMVKESDTPENRQAVEAIQNAMHQQVKRMVAVAGKTEAEAKVGTNPSAAETTLSPVAK
jgi:apolipoprotein N-acyltransferase